MASCSYSPSVTADPWWNMADPWEARDDLKKVDKTIDPANIFGAMARSIAESCASPSCKKSLLWTIARAAVLPAESAATTKFQSEKPVLTKSVNKNLFVNTSAKEKPAESATTTNSRSEKPVVTKPLNKKLVENESENEKLAELTSTTMSKSEKSVSTKSLNKKFIESTSENEKFAETQTESEKRSETNQHATSELVAVDNITSKIQDQGDTMPISESITHPVELETHIKEDIRTMLLQMQQKLANLPNKTDIHNAQSKFGMKISDGT